MHVVVPYAAERPKTRLSEVLDAAERRDFSRAMLDDVLAAVDGAVGDDPDVTVEVLATTEIDDVEVAHVVDERPLTTAVNDVLESTDVERDPVAVVMSDLALATPGVLCEFLGTGGDVVVAPGLGAGTNALLVRHPGFRVDYHGTSYLDHLEIADGLGATVEEFDSRRLSVDIDEPADLVEVLVHSDGSARDWLVDAGFELDVSGGRVGITRNV